MTRSLTLRLLGAGSSSGVPRIGGDWGVCDPAEPRNRRSRASALVERRGGKSGGGGGEKSEGGGGEKSGEKSGGTTRVLVDTSPDLREQLLRADVGLIDGVVFTHAHADQTHGIDDLRSLVINARRAGRTGRLPVWMDAVTHASLTQRFAYCFAQDHGYPAILDAKILAVGETIRIDGAGGTIEAQAFLQGHGPIDALGYRFGDIAYSPDAKTLPAASFAALEGVDWWVVDALQREEHPTHAHLALTLEWIAKVKPRLGAVLTNMHIGMDYATLCAELPQGIVPGYDGMLVASD